MDNTWIKINNNIYYIEKFDIENTSNNFDRRKLTIAFDLSKYPNYDEDLFKIYDDRKYVNMSTNKLLANNSQIVSISSFDRYLEMVVICHNLKTNKKEFRNEQIDKILKY